MTEKVKLPKAVCDALDMAKAKGFNSYEIIKNTHEETWLVNELDILNLQLTGEIMRALVLGYEPEMTAEEQIKDLYFGCSKSFADDEIYRCGVRDALRIHAIHYDWLEGDAE